MLLRLLLPALVILGSLGMTGCQVVPDARPDPTEFFVLTSPSPADPVPLPASPTGVTLGLHTIHLPVYLADSRAIAVRQPGHRIVYRDFQRWAEPLDAGVARLLRTALTTTPGIARVVTLPFPVGVHRDNDLQITVLAAEGFADDNHRQVHFALDFSVLTPSGELLAHGVHHAPPSPWDGTSGQLARRLSQAIANSAEVIAAHLPPTE